MTGVWIALAVMAFLAGIGLGYAAGLKQKLTIQRVDLDGADHLHLVEPE